MSCLWGFIESLRCCPVVQLFLPRFIRASMCSNPCVPYSDPFLGPRSEEGHENMSLFVFSGKPETWRAPHNATDSIYWNLVAVVVVATRVYLMDFSPWSESRTTHHFF